MEETPPQRRQRHQKRYVGCLLCPKARTTRDVCRTCAREHHPTAIALLQDPANVAAARAALRLGGRRALHDWFDAAAGCCIFHDGLEKETA